MPKPRLRGKRLADYDESYVRSISYIKDLQDNYDLPISVIKQILKRQKRVSRLEQSLFRLQSKYFSPRAHLLRGEVVGEHAFEEATGLVKQSLQRVEEWGIITPQIREGRKVYSHEDVTLGKLIVEMDTIGMGQKDGFTLDPLKYSIESMSKLVRQINGYFAEVYWGKLLPKEFHEKGIQALEITAIYFYHLFRKLCREDTLAQVRRLEEHKKPEPAQAKADHHRKKP